MLFLVVVYDVDIITFLILTKTKIKFVFWPPGWEPMTENWYSLKYVKCMQFGGIRYMLNN